MTSPDPPRNISELIGRAKRTRERIAMHHKAMADVAAQAAANNAAQAQNGGGNS
jgi:ABC-type Fe3+-citrate transport system substrate-binding protein